MRRLTYVTLDNLDSILGPTWLLMLVVYTDEVWTIWLLMLVLNTDKVQIIAFFGPRQSVSIVFCAVHF